MNIKSTVAILGITAGVFAIPATAQVGAKSSAVYIGGSIGQGTLRDGCKNSPLGAGLSCNEGDTAWKVLAGYQVNRNLAFELGYQDAGTPLKAAAGANTTELKENVWDAVAVGTQRLTDVFSVYGKFGGFHSTVDQTSNVPGLSASASKNGLTFGLGMRFDATRNIAVRGEWQRYLKVGGGQIGTDDLDVISIGVLWMFR